MLGEVVVLAVVASSEAGQRAAPNLAYRGLEWSGVVETPQRPLLDGIVVGDLHGFHCVGYADILCLVETSDLDILDKLFCFHCFLL